MVASKDLRNYTSSGRSPMSSLREDRVRIPQLNALKFLQWGVKKRERGRRSLVEDYPNEVSRVRPLGRVPWLPLYRVQGLITYKRVRFSRPSGRAPEGGETSYLGLQGRLSCRGVSVRPNVFVIMVLCPRRGMGSWRYSVGRGGTIGMLVVH